MPCTDWLAAQLAQEAVYQAQNCCRFLEEEAEEVSRLHKEHAAEAKAKRQQQLERERMVCICLTPPARCHQATSALPPFYITQSDHVPSQKPTCCCNLNMARPLRNFCRIAK